MTLRLRTVDLPQDLDPLVDLILRCDLRVADWATPAALPSAADEAAGWHDLALLRGARMSAIVDDEDTILGVCAYAEATATDGTAVEGTAHISALFVEPTAWRQGIGRRLLHWAESTMIDTGFTTGRLTTLEGSPAEHLYTACGWHRSGERGIYPKMDLPTVRYVKPLARSSGG